MRHLFALLLCLLAFSASAQLPPILRLPWTTNTDGTGLNGVDAVTIDGLDKEGITNVVNAVVEDELANAVLVTDQTTQILFNTTSPAAFPFGIVGQARDLQMFAVNYGTAVTFSSGTAVGSTVTNLGNSGILPAFIPVLANSLDPSTNFVDYFVTFPAAPIYTNDPVLTFESWDSSTTVSNAIFDISYVIITNQMRWDNVAKSALGSVTNNHVPAGQGPRFTRATFTMTGVGTNFTNPLYTGIIIRIARENDGFLAGVGIGNDVRLRVVK